MTTRRDVLRAAAAAAVAPACDRAAPPAGPPTTRAAARSATPNATATASEPVTVVRVAALADGTAAIATRDAVLVIRGGRIAYAGARDGAPAFAAADAIDLSGATAVPAMVDCHVHLTGAGGASAYARLQDPDATLLARAAENARLLARGGVLGARDVGAVRTANVRARDALRGAADAPVIAAAGTWLGRRGRYVSFAIQVDTAEELLAAALAQLDAGADIVKVAADGATASAASWTAGELRPVVEAAHARGKTVAAHAQGYGARPAVEAGVDTVEHGFVVDAPTARAMAGSTTLVTSLSVAQAFGQLDVALPSIRAARDAGVRIAAGTDAGGGPPVFGQFPLEVELLVRAGLAPHQALAAATRAGGAVMGVPGLGTLDAGAPASFVLVDGDPLQDPAALRRVRGVFHRGVRLV